MLVDLIIIGIIALCIFLGFKRGLIGVAFKFISLIIAIVLALLLHGPVSNFIINNTTIDEKIEEVISKNVDFSKYENKSIDEISNENNNIPDVLFKQFKDSIQESIDSAKGNVQQAIVKKLSNSIINITIILILFILIKIILAIINLMADIISKLPVINQFNKLGGVIYGLIEGFLIIYILMAICLIIAPLIQATGIIEMINSSSIGKILYDNNILLKFIG